MMSARIEKIIIENFEQQFMDMAVPGVSPCRRVKPPLIQAFPSWKTLNVARE